MGIKYVIYKAAFEISRKIGFLQLFYPTNVPYRQFFNLQQWRQNYRPFFILNTNKTNNSDEEKNNLRSSFELIKNGSIQFFTGEWFHLGIDHNWAINPENGIQFDRYQHWTRVSDFNATFGDIKYVWEKARFIYLHTIIHHDYANNEDNSSFVWKEILSWIKNTTYNCGPHYKCSQEISIRLLNWVYALYYYKDSKSLTNLIFSEIMNSIYWQTRHVEQNHIFSKIAVRNNHAITEALCLFTIGLLFPWFPDSKRWYQKGKKSLEEEGVYQIYPDGSYIQHSFNYQRVVIQLYTWALSLAEYNDVSFKPELINRLKECVLFMHKFINPDNGHVPNWGANDSALFFPFNNCAPRDFRPQINALYIYLFHKNLYTGIEFEEDANWFGLYHIINTTSIQDSKPSDQSNIVSYTNGIYSYSDGGYYILKGQNGSTFIRCAKYKHRPYHADNLHVDIWYQNSNILRDAGTYKYNTDSDTVRFFCGSEGHNTIMIDHFDQMEKGSRFIWYKWSECIEASVNETEDYLQFKGTINAFKYIRTNIFHTRIIKAFKKFPIWQIQDRISGASGYQISQHWNLGDEFFEKGFNIQCISDRNIVHPETAESWYSEYYGKKQSAQKIIFRSLYSELTTIIYHETLKQKIGKIFI